MKCPSCENSTLVMSDRQGVEIDYCPQCRGVWLDRGELDKIIERAPGAVTARQPTPASGARRPDFEDSDYSKGQYADGRRKKSWLNEIFD